MENSVLKKVAIIGIGCSGFRAVSPDFHFHELSFHTAKKAYLDAGVDARRDIDGYIMCDEDTEVGQQIADVEFPDPIGAALTPSIFLANDGIMGLIAAYLQIFSGMADIIAVEVRSKASNILTYRAVEAFALDPILHRPLKMNPLSVAAMEMNRFLHESKNSIEQCALVSVKNKRNAMSNPLAAYADTITVEDVLCSEMMCYPMRSLDMSSEADGSVCVVLASEEKAKYLCKKPIWVKGFGSCIDSSGLEQREWGRAVFAEISAKRAYEMAGIRSPKEEIDFAEVDDTYSFKELQHLEAMKLCRPGEAGHLLEEGAFDLEGTLPVNISGGAIGQGRPLCANGLSKILEVVTQLRGEAGKRQIRGANTGLAQYWRGIPTAKGGVVILSNVEGR